MELYQFPSNREVSLVDTLTLIMYREGKKFMIGLEEATWVTKSCLLCSDSNIADI